jgi:hypothetical protein
MCFFPLITWICKILMYSKIASMERLKIMAIFLSVPSVLKLNSGSNGLGSHKCSHQSASESCYYPIKKFPIAAGVGNFSQFAEKKVSNGFAKCLIWH